MGRLEFTTLPVPAFAEHTVRIPAGVITFGVEYRHLDEATILAFYGPDSRAKFGNKMPAGMTAVVEEDGLSLHVFDSATGDELLRFDCFAEAAHWHLLSVTGFAQRRDRARRARRARSSSGRSRRCAPTCRTLLRDAGADAVADALDDDVVASALDTVTQTARYVAAAGRPVRVD